MDTGMYFIERLELLLVLRNDVPRITVELIILSNYCYASTCCTYQILFLL